MTRRSERRRTGDAWASRAEEGRGTLRKASGSRVQAKIRRCPNGETRTVKSGTSRKGGEPGEVKHLSTLRKRNDSASSGERKRSSPNRELRLPGLKGQRKASKAEPNGAGKADRRR
jgi:hypothetical protein